MSTSTISFPTTARARLAAYNRFRGPDDPLTKVARQDLDVARLANHIKRVVDSFPPLTTAQKRELAGLLRGGK